jgi:hypothetical protein
MMPRASTALRNRKLRPCGAWTSLIETAHKAALRFPITSNPSSLPAASRRIDSRMRLSREERFLGNCGQTRATFKDKKELPPEPIST